MQIIVFRILWFEISWWIINRMLLTICFLFKNRTKGGIWSIGTNVKCGLRALGAIMKNGSLHNVFSRVSKACFLLGFQMKGALSPCILLLSRTVPYKNVSKKTCFLLQKLKLLRIFLFKKMVHFWIRGEKFASHVNSRSNGPPVPLFTVLLIGSLHCVRRIRCRPRSNWYSFSRHGAVALRKTVRLVRGWLAKKDSRHCDAEP